MLRKFCTISMLLILSSMFLIMSNTADAHPNVKKETYRVRQIICSEGYVGHSYTTGPTYSKHTINHPRRTIKCRTVIEPETGFEYEICRRVHTSHSIEVIKVYITTKKRDRYHWSCR